MKGTCMKYILIATSAIICAADLHFFPTHRANITAQQQLSLCWSIPSITCTCHARVVRGMERVRGVVVKIQGTEAESDRLCQLCVSPLLRRPYSSGTCPQSR